MLDDSVDVALFHNHIFGTIDVNLCTTVFSVKHVVAHLYGHGYVFGAFSYCYYFTSLWFFFCGVRNNDARSGLLFCNDLLHKANHEHLILFHILEVSLLQVLYLS